LGHGLDFDGVDDVVRLDARTVGGFPFTVTAWVRPGATSGSACAVYLGTIGQNYGYFTIGASSGKAEIAGHISERPRERYAASGTSTLSDGEWHHIAGVFETAAEKRLYVDGRLEASLREDLAFADSINRCSLGQCDMLSRRFPWSGGIDDVRVYSALLSEDQILAVAEESIPMTDRDGDGLPDGWERLHFGSTNATDGGRFDDRDGDGMNNAGEYESGTDPTNPASVFRLGIDSPDGTVAVSWHGVAAGGLYDAGLVRLYSLEQRTNLLTGGWAPVPGYTNVPGADELIVHTNVPGTSPGMYRGSVQLD
jgi:hypothetical protein